MKTITIYNSNGSTKEIYKGQIDFKDNSNYKDTYVIVTNDSTIYLKLGYGEYIEVK